MTRSLYLLVAVACLATAPAPAQQPAAGATQAPVAAQPAPARGPRLAPGFRSYQPALAHDEAATAAAAAAADRTVITISTLGLVLLGVLLIILLS